MIHTFTWIFAGWLRPEPREVRLFGFGSGLTGSGHRPVEVTIVPAGTTRVKDMTGGLFSGADATRALE